MKNVGIVTTWFERGASYVSRQYMELLQNDFNLFIYARGGEYYAKDDEKWNLDNVTWAKKFPLPVHMAIERDDFTKWIKQNNIDIILFNEQQWWLPIIWAKELGVIVGSYIDYYTEETVPLFSIYDFLICNTKRHYEVFSWHKNSYYIPWGTNIKIFSPNSYKLIDDEVVTFFHSSGMSPDRKGTRAVIKSFENLTAPKKLIIHTQIDLIKKLPDIKKNILLLLDSCELEIINKTIGAPGLYHLGDIYVYPSKLEGIGLTISEALSSGLPTIVPDNQPMNEFIDSNNGKVIKITKLYSRLDGYYWPQCEVDIEDLTNKMQWYINNKKDIFKYKKLAREYSEKYLDWEQNRLKLVEIFNNVTFNDSYNKELIFSFEKHKSSTNWILKLYFYSPFLFKLLSNIYLFVKGQK